ncbi:MAG: universal stress protein [Bacteroidota bacterium]
MNILCPTDFSTVADHAYDAACKLAQKLGSTLYLFHCNELGKDWSTDEEWNEQFDPLQEEAGEAATDQLLKLRDKAELKGVNCEIKQAEGDFLAELLRFTEEVAFDLVVMGSHGASGKREWLMGSNTQKAIRKLHVNTLVVKSALPQISFPKVVFASGLLLEDQEAFRRFLKLSEALDIKELHVLSIRTSGFFTPPRIIMQEALKDFEAIASDHAVTTHYHTDISIEAGIRRFAEEEKADLIAISNHIRHPMKRIFRGSTVEMIVNHASVPVLSIDYPAEE